MKTRAQIFLISTVIITAIAAALFINKSRLDANTEHIAAKPAAISVAQAVRKSIPLQLSSIGVLRAYNDIPVIAETQGKVLRRFVDVGDHVRAGDPIVKVDTLLKYATYVAAKTVYVKAESDLARFKALHAQGNISISELELAGLNSKSAHAQYLVAKRQYEDADICAPISGEIAERAVDVGMIVSAGAVIASIVDVSRLKITITVAENIVSRIKKGMAVTATVEAFPGAAFEGIVMYVGPKANESLLFPIEIVIPNSRKFPLKPGMTASIVFTSVTAAQTLMIPRASLVGSAREASVFLVANNRVHLRSVSIGREYGFDVEVLSGIVSGDSVVVVGKNTVHDNAPVTIIQ